LISLVFLRISNLPSSMLVMRYFAFWIFSPPPLPRNSPHPPWTSTTTTHPSLPPPPPSPPNTMSSTTGLTTIEVSASPENHPPLRQWPWQNAKPLTPERDHHGSHLRDKDRCYLCCKTTVTITKPSWGTPTCDATTWNAKIKKTKRISWKQIFSWNRFWYSFHTLVPEPSSATTWGVQPLLFFFFPIGAQWRFFTTSIIWHTTTTVNHGDQKLRHHCQTTTLSPCQTWESHGSDIWEDSDLSLCFLFFSFILLIDQWKFDSGGEIRIGDFLVFLEWGRRWWWWRCW